MAKAKQKLEIVRKERRTSGDVRLHFKQKAKLKKGVVDPKPIDVAYRVADKFEVGEEYDIAKLNPKKEEEKEEEE